MQPIINITALILAGGLGTRLRSVVADRPKVLAQIHGQPYLAYLLHQLATAGIQNVILCTGYKGEQIQAAFGEQYQGLNLIYSQETTPLGTAGAIRLALPLTQSDIILGMNGDSFCQIDFADFLAWHHRQNCLGSIVLSQVSDVSRYGQVQLNNRDQIKEFIEKGVSQGTGWINTGVYLLSQHLLQSIPPNQTVSIEKEMFPNWAKQGVLSGYQNQGNFLDIGTPDSYAQAETFFADYRLT